MPLILWLRYGAAYEVNPPRLLEMLAGENSGGVYLLSESGDPAIIQRAIDWMRSRSGK